MITWEARHEFETEQTAFESCISDAIMAVGFSRRWYRQLWVKCKRRCGFDTGQSFFRCDFVFPSLKRILEVDGHPINTHKDFCLTGCHAYDVWHIENSQVLMLSKAKALMAAFVSLPIRSIPVFPFYRLHQLKGVVYPNGRPREDPNATSSDPIITAALQVLACFLMLYFEPSGKLMREAIMEEFPPERYPSESLSGLAEVIYLVEDGLDLIGIRDRIVDVNSKKIFIDQVIGYFDPNLGLPEIKRAITASLETFSREESKVESKGRRERLKNATPDEEAEVLRLVLNAKKKRPRDHGIIPWR